MNYFGILIIGVTLFISSCGTSSSMRGPDPGMYPEHADWDPDAPGQKIEEGMASWYGPGFHGKLTANGEPYDMDQLTAAHRTLPFNSIVKVRNLSNGESVLVRINDRGPFAKGRIIDLSRKAAREIGMIGSGTANVALMLMNDTLKHSRTTDLKTATYTIQLGSYREKNKAFEHSRTIHGSRVETINKQRSVFYRVYYGTFVDKSKARQKQQELDQRGFRGYVKQLQN